MAIDPNIDTSLSGAPPTRPLSGLEMGLGGGAFSGTTAQPSGGLSGTGKGGGMTGGLSLAELQLLLSLGGGGDTGNSSSLLAPLGAASFGQGGAFGQPQGGQNTVAGQSMTAPTGQVAGGGGSSTVDPFSLLAKIAGGVGKAAAGLASPTMGDSAVGLTEGDISGTTPEARVAFQQQRADERTASPTNVSLSPFQIPSGILTGASGGSVAPSSGDFTPMSPQSVADLLKQQENMDLSGAGSGGGQNLPLGSNTTASSISGAPLNSGIPGSANVVPSTNFGGALQGGIGAGTGLLGLWQALQGGNAGQGIQGGVGFLQGIGQILASSPELAKSLGLGGVDIAKFMPKAIGSGSPGSLAGAGLGLLGSLTGSQGLSELGKDVGGISSLVSTVGPMVSAIQAGDTAAFEAATAALSAAAPAAAVAAAIQMALTLASGIQAGNPGPQIALDTLASPDIIASNVMSHFIDPMFHPSEAYTTFPQRAGETAGMEQRSLNALMQGLPYVQSQQELANTVAAFKNAIGTEVGGYGQGSGPLDIPMLPEIGTKTHGMPTMPSNFAAITPEIQQVINALNPVLPATDTLSGDPLMRTFTQFLNRRGTGDYAGAAPIETFTNDPNYATYAAISNAQRPYTNRLIEQSNQPYDISAGPQETVRQYGDPGYDYAAAGFPEPGRYLGSVSPFWQQLGLPMPQYPTPPPLAQLASGPLTNIAQDQYTPSFQDLSGPQA